MDVKHNHEGRVCDSHCPAWVRDAPLAVHEEMDRWKSLPVWAQQELEQWRVDEAFQRGRAEEAERAMHWEDLVDEWTAPIKAAHPTRSNAHEEYAVAMKMVGHRHSKGELVSLVSWLLVRIRNERADVVALLYSLADLHGPHAAYLRVLATRIGEEHEHLGAAERRRVRTSGETDPEGT